MATTKFSNLFITGCDSNTEWQLPWFIKNFKKHNPDAALKIYDFGMSNPNPKLFEKIHSSDKGWFKKPFAMMTAARIATNVCWLDTDCEVREDLSDLFNYVEPNKLTMAEDVPWSKRRGEKWHNSGVVAFTGVPNILKEWANAVSYRPIEGDQQVLHELVKGDMKRMIHISDLPRKYNTLRLDLVDESTPSKISIMHWTGHLGNEEIKRKMINEALL